MARAPRLDCPLQCGVTHAAANLRFDEACPKRQCYQRRQFGEEGADAGHADRDRCESVVPCNEARTRQHLNPAIPDVFNRSLAVCSSSMTVHENRQLLLLLRGFS